MQKIITGLFLLIMTFSAYSEDNVPAGLNDYVVNLVDKATTILKSQGSQDAKITKARELMYNNLDFNWMARYTLGRNGVKTLSKEQIDDFTKVYSQYVTKAYTNLIKDYKGEKPVIKGTRSLSPTEFMVTTNIVSNKEQDPIEVKYLVRKENGKDVFKISDVITEGISLVDGQQKEFEEILKNQGIDALKQSLKSRS